ncbi:MAG: D-glycero-beta-D-manno-heptose 1,7-bisphosphate 7-phosphatase [Desulfosarcinaceae bacterium]|nr:D-glycero-beta-D-manno-heptose 1,7-bisphosphate 7-phosphatase [Desulfosarcinaceae bacterium]
MKSALQHAGGTLKVVFLDRDGVINRDSPDYIKSWREFEFISGSLSAMARLTRAGFTLMLISNQSAVGRELISRPGLARLHYRLGIAAAQAGGRIRDIFFCPHLPDSHCHCRKPATGMLQQASAKYGLDLSKSVFVGDSVTDIRCAQAAGCDKSILVLTGNGSIASRDLTRQAPGPDHVAADLAAAAEWILDPSPSSAA